MPFFPLGRRGGTLFNSIVPGLKALVGCHMNSQTPPFILSFIRLVLIAPSPFSLNPKSPTHFSIPHYVPLHSRRENAPKKKREKKKANILPSTQNPPSQNRCNIFVFVYCTIRAISFWCCVSPTSVALWLYKHFHIFFFCSNI